MIEEIVQSVRTWVAENIPTWQDLKDSMESDDEDPLRSDNLV